MCAMIFIRDSEVGYVIAIQPSTIQDSMSKVGGGRSAFIKRGLFTFILNRLLEFNTFFVTTSKFGGLSPPYQQKEPLLLRLHLFSLLPLQVRLSLEYLQENPLK